MPTGDDKPELWWNHRGELSSDEALENWTGLVIVRIVDWAG